jgi:adenine phosphoribosyltransferase
MDHDASWLYDHIRDVPDFPQPGVVFKDITPLLGHVDAFRFTVDAIADTFAGTDIDKVVGIEARGFLFAAPVAYRIGAGCVPLRKPGKLPFDTIEHSYELEYGVDSLSAHIDAVEPGERVLIVDDVLATGGTARAACELLARIGAEIVALTFLLELGFLDGRTKLEGQRVESLLRID